MGNVKLDNYSKTEQGQDVKTKGDDVQTTTYGDVMKEKTEVKSDPLLMEEQRKSFEENVVKPLAKQYDVNPATGKYEGNVGALLGIDPAIYQRQQEEKAAQARQRQKLANWRNALGVISDVVSAAHGGNAWVRPKDEIAKEADAEIEKRGDNIQNMAMAFERAKRGREQEYLKAVQEQMEKYRKEFGSTTTTEYTQHGQDKKQTQHGTEVTTHGDKVTSGYREAQEKDYSGGSAYVGRDGKVDVAYTTESGERKTFRAPRDKALSYARFAIDYLMKWYNNNPEETDGEGNAIEGWRNRNRRDVEEALKMAGITEPGDWKANNKELTMDDYYRFLANGRVFSISGISDEMNKLYKEEHPDDDVTFIPMDVAEQRQNDRDVRASGGNVRGKNKEPKAGSGNRFND